MVAMKGAEEKDRAKFNEDVEINVILELILQIVNDYIDDEREEIYYQAEQDILDGE